MSLRLRLRNFYRQAYAAITDFGAYLHFYPQAPRRTLSYLLLLIVHVGAAKYATILVSAIPETRRLADWAQRAFPPLEIRRGELVVHRELPLVRRYPHGPSPSFVFVESLEEANLPSYTPPAVFLTREALVIFGEDGFRFEWATLLGRPDVARLDVGEVIRQSAWAGALVLAPLVLLAQLLFIALMVVLFAFLAYVAGMRGRRRFSKEGSFNLGSYGITAALAVQIFGEMLGVRGDVFQVIILATAGIYVYAAASKCRPPEEA